MYILNESWDSAVSIVIAYRLDSQGVGVRVPVGTRIFTSPCPLSSGAHPASYPMDTEWSLPRDTMAGV
jgi:hypothetical protein